MAFTVTFPTNEPLPDVDALSDWLTTQGEPFERDGPSTLALRALPVRLIVDDAGIQAPLDLSPDTSLTRLVRLVFDLSVRLGGDVRLAGAGETTRADLWLRLADEQDRLRIVQALERATAHGHADEVVRGLWSVLGSLGHGRDLRWDAARRRIVDMLDVGGPDGLPVEEAAWHDADASEGDTVAVPVSGDLHILAWRWLGEAWPSLRTA